MKLKFLKVEFEFDKDDAQIVVPLILLVLGLTLTPLPKTWLLAGAVVYYMLFFFIPKTVEPLKKWLVRQYNKWAYKCPYCKSQHTVMLGLQEYLGDIPYNWSRCNDCGEESVFLDDRLVKPGAWKNLTNGK